MDQGWWLGTAITFEEAQSLACASAEALPPSWLAHRFEELARCPSHPWRYRVLNNTSDRQASECEVPV